MNDFEKFIFPIISNNKTFYIVDGADESDPEEKNFVLCEMNKMLFFTSIENLKNYISTHVTKDNEIMKKWCAQISEDSIEEAIDIDLILNSLGKACKFYDLHDVVIHNMFEFLLILKDYFYEYKTELADESLNDKNIDLFLEYCYDRYLWKDREDKAREAIKKLNFNNFKKSIKKYVDFFGENQIIYNTIH